MTSSIDKLLTKSGKITIAALDHRGSLKKSLHPDNPEITTDKEILSWKKRMIDLFNENVSGILIDPIYGKDLVDLTLNCGWLLSMEQTGYEGAGNARVTTLLENMNASHAKVMGASGVKLLLFYDPFNEKLAAKQKKIAEQVAADCKTAGIVFLLEPLSYNIKDEDRPKVVLETVRQLKDIGINILKIEYPGNRETCVAVTNLVNMPWVLLSAGKEYAPYKKSLQIACESGASGMAVGRAIWQEFGDYQGEERERYLCDVASQRLVELVAIVEKFGRSVHELAQA